MSAPTSIRPFIKADLPEILLIANSRFGNQYLNLDELNNYLNNNNKMGVVAIVKEEIAGFALFQIVDIHGLMPLLLCEKDWIKDQFLDTDSIGILKSIAVRTKYSNLGIGKALTKYRIDILKKTSDRIMAISWEQHLNTSNTKILEKFGFSLKRKIENYWSEDSIQQGYRCELCGEPPCTCSALIYII